MKAKALCGMVCLAFVLAVAIPTWSTPVAANGLFAGGDGSSGNPYQIANWEQLHWVRNYLSSHFILINDLGPTTPGYGDRAGAFANGGAGWLPIGDSNRFAGSFDGQRYEIQGLFIRRSEQYSGLFGAVDAAGVVKAVRLTNCDIVGLDSVGTIAGSNWGTISDCCATNLLVGQYDAGGLVGWNYGSVERCYSTCSVEGDAFAGGLVAANAGGASVIDSFAVGDVRAPGMAYASIAGGLIGLNSGTVTNCFYGANQVTGDTVGGLIGEAIGGSVSDSYWDTQVTGLPASDGGTGRTTEQLMKYFLTYFGGGWDMTLVDMGEMDCTATWNIVEGRSYPFLPWYQARFDLKTGWNMVTVPEGLPTGQDTVAQVFQGEITDIYVWDAASKMYSALGPTVPVEPGVCYWVAVTEDKVVTKWL